MHALLILKKNNKAPGGSAPAWHDSTSSHLSMTPSNRPSAQQHGIHPACQDQSHMCTPTPTQITELQGARVIQQNIFPDRPPAWPLFPAHRPRDVNTTLIYSLPPCPSPFIFQAPTLPAFPVFPPSLCRSSTHVYRAEYTSSSANAAALLPPRVWGCMYLCVYVCSSFGCELYKLCTYPCYICLLLFSLALQMPPSLIGKSNQGLHIRLLVWFILASSPCPLST